MSTNRYADASVVVLSLAAQDSSGSAFVADTAEYKVTDQTGAEITARVAVPGYVAAADPIALTIAALDNTLAAGVNRMLRRVTLYLANAVGTEVSYSTDYLIENTDYVVKGSNSFQTLEEAILNSFDIPGLEDSWGSASDDEKKAGLVAAYQRLSRASYIDDDGNYITNLDTYDATELDGLTSGLAQALKLAQVAEAGDMLGADSIADLRADGLMATSIGEVSQMFRSGKPTLLPVSSKAAKHLVGYISYRMSITRA